MLATKKKKPFTKRKHGIHKERYCHEKPDLGPFNFMFSVAQHVPQKYTYMSLI